MATAEPEAPRSWHSMNGIVKMPSRLEETVSSNANAVLPPTVCSAQYEWHHEAQCEWLKMPSRLEETVSSNASAVLPPTVCSAHDNIPLSKCDPSIQHCSSDFFGAL